MLNCKEVTEMCSQELERPLLLRERVSQRMHLMMCNECTNFRVQVQAMHIAMQRYASGAAVSTSDDTTGEQ